MSDSTQPPRDPEDPTDRPPPEQPPTSPFPESSLGSQEAPPPPVEPTSEPATAPAPEPPAPQSWTAPPDAPTAPIETPPAPIETPPAREWAAPSPPAPGSGLTSGDPLGGSTPAPLPGSTFPPGYTSPPPPGYGGGPPAYAAPAPGTYQLGSWGARVGAAIIDGLIIGIPAVIVMAALGIGAAGSDGDGGTAAFVGGLLLALLVFLIVGLLYAPLMMSRTNGQTVGRMATGIRVIRAGGEPMTFGFAALREIAVKGLLVGTVSSFTFGIGYLIDILWPLWDDENRALHDMVVNTRTVKA